MFCKSSSFPLLFALFSLVSCASPKEYPGKFKGEEIHFGQGGGFTGEVTYFVLLDDGRLYQRGSRDSTFTFLDTWDDRFVSQMFLNYKSLQLNKVEFCEPGDIYYFILYKSGNSPSHQIAWGKPGTRPDEIIVTYYNLLYKSTKSKS